MTFQIGHLTIKPTIIVFPQLSSKMLQETEWKAKQLRSQYYEEKNINKVQYYISVYSLNIHVDGIIWTFECQ